MILTPEELIKKNLCLIRRSDTKGIIQPLLDKNYPELINKAQDNTEINFAQLCPTRLYKIRNWRQYFRDAMSEKSESLIYSKPEF